MNEEKRRRLAETLQARLETTKGAHRQAVEEAFRCAREATSVPSPPAALTPQTLAGMIDHTALKPQTTEADVRQLCDEARRYGFASVCINPCYVQQAAADVQASPVKVCTVIGFPLGATLPAVKAEEARQAIKAGADEVDMVQNVGLLKSGRYADVQADIQAVVEAARTPHQARGRRSGGALVKVILETALLTDEEKMIACVLAEAAGADFVKTSTGFSTGGATPEDIALMRLAVGDRLGIKASGGVRSFKEAQAVVAQGATRIGASSSVALVEGTVSSASSY